MSEVNGTALLQGAGQKEFSAPPELINLIESLLRGVKAGRITSLACITVSPMGQMQWPGFGNQVSEIMIGAELMRDDMKKAMREVPGRILRPGG